MNTARLRTPAPGRHGRPPPPRRAAATSIRGMREPPSPGECPGQQRAPIPAHTHTQATPRRRPFHPETQAMWGSQELLPLWFLVLAAGGMEHVYRPGRRVCVVGAPQGPASESFVQRVYQPFLTTCDGYRACSTYRTLYRTAYRRRPGPDPTRPRYACCPGWKWTGGVPGACGAAICQPPCQNGGSCVQPGRCHCPAGWQGNACQTDVDECSAGEGGCPQRCVNTAGSYWCQCWEGHRPSVDRAVCLPERGAPRVTPDPTTARHGARPRTSAQTTLSTAAVLGTLAPGGQAWERTVRSRRKYRGSSRGWTCWSRSCSSCWPHCTAWPPEPWSTDSLTQAASWPTPSSSWTASTL
ncbi:epidermal growth factor-like protein 7 isoform X2 [Bos indicus]|uniref:Epidermal growth factor-like protein 7 isoform X2 n=1 Tax=Bos indicus TaxID=9915 RepID=A0ABM4T6N6_BOSIN|nr:epidermal growth factor-like protein 7 isoform X2 [Bos indicus x Bos taurus]